MAKGRPRTPTALLKLHGTYEECKHGERIDEQLPVLKISTIDPPATLSQKAIQRWNTIIPALLNAKIIAEQDIALLETAFILMGESFDALDEINKIKAKNKITDKDILKREKLNRWLVRSIKESNVILSKFGIGPSERAKLTVSSVPKEEKDLDPLSVVLGEDD